MLHLNPSLKSLFGLRYIVVFFIVLQSALHAQLLDPQDSTVIQDIVVDYEGVKTVSEEAVMAHIKIKEGMVYNQNLVDQSLHSLYATGLYQFIQVKREPMTGGGSRLRFMILPKYRISTIRFEGNDRISERKLEEIAELEIGASLDEVKVKEARDAIFKYYQEKGYSQADIDYNITRSADYGTGVVSFNVSEGPRVKISKIKFVGNDHIKSGTLRGQMKTSKRNFISWITGTGRFKEQDFEDDLQRLKEFYQNEGFLDVEIAQSDVIFDYPKSGKLVIIVQVTEGQKYNIGEISISGNEIYDNEVLMDQIDIASGDTFSPNEVDKASEALKDHYGKVGYLDTIVRAERRPNIDTGNIDLNFDVRESDKFYLESINIQGNTKTKSTVILRELALAPGEVFDLVKMKNSEARLRNTGFFEEVNLSPEATNIPARRNLRVTVKEGRTGNLTFGAGFSSVENAVAFAEVTQGNFDLFNYRSMFQGDGQKFRLRLSVGTESNQITLAFEEPWLFERQLALGFEAFRTESEFNSNVYDELRTGFEVYLRKRLFELVEGRLSYRLESVKITDIEAGASTAIRNEQGSTLVSKIGLSFLRDTRNNLLTPSEGSRYQLLTEYAGGPVAGDVDYVRFEGRAAHWWPTFEFQKQVFSIVGRSGTVASYNDSRVPFFDRFFLGGPNSLRGFDFREVGPKDSNNEPIGGKSFAFFSTEYSFEVVDPVRFAVFYDGGFANSSSFDFSPDSYNDDVGFGLRILILGAPLRVDIGFPLQTDAVNDDGVQFNFSFGTVF